MSKENKLPLATHEGTIDINGVELRCYNLNTGERVLSRESLLKAIGRTGKPKFKESDPDNGVFQLPTFLRANNLKSFISRDLTESSQPIIFEMRGGQKAYGYPAIILPSICYVFTDAKKAGVLSSQQEIYAERCEILIRGFATVGIIALVDEATGYQYERERDELQKILKAYISNELLPWQKRFPDEFYKEIFRLNHWDYTVKGIQQRPGVIGTWTKQLIYAKLPNGVLRELIKKTPKSKSGNYSARLHQSLTLDMGHPHLEKQLISVITLMNVSNDWEEFLRLFNKKFGQLEIEFDKAKEIEPKSKEVELSSFNKTLKRVLRVPKPTNDSND